MAYKDNGMAAEAPAPDGNEMAGGANEGKGGGEGETLFLSADMLPPDCPHEVGDVLTFKVIKSEGGDIEVAYDKGEEKKPEPDEVDSFRNDFAKEMSARNPETPDTEGI